MNLEDKKKEILDTFKDLSFREDTHQYFLGDRNLKYSVSGIIKKYSNPFNTDQIAPFSAKNAFGVEVDAKARCVFASNGETEITIIQD